MPVNAHGRQGRRTYPFMRRVLGTDLGSENAKRTVELVFAPTKLNRRLDRFRRRGRSPCLSEWWLVEWCLVTATHTAPAHKHHMASATV